MMTFSTSPTLSTDPSRAIIIEQILARVSKGESLREILAAKPYPSESTWAGWMARDHTLQAAYIAAVNSSVARHHESFGA